MSGQRDEISGESKPAPAGAPDPLLLRGHVLRITYENSSSGFSVFSFCPERENDSGQDRVTVVGKTSSPIKPGMHVMVRGVWNRHDRFGLQFRAFSITEVEPVGSEAVERYLASGAIKGLGPVLAKRIVDEFGDDALQIIESEPERLRRVPGIGEKKYDEIVAAWNESRAARELHLFFEQYDIPSGLARRIINAYGPRAVEVVKENPYLLARDMWGVGFVTADALAMKLGFERESPFRVSSGIAYVLRKAADEGHCFMPEEELIRRASTLLGIESAEVLQKGLDRALLEGDTVKDGERIYSVAIFQYEEELADLLAARVKGMCEPEKRVPESVAHEIADRAQLSVVRESDADVLRLSPEQRDALVQAAKYTMLVVTGGPGCGKTTVVRSLVAMFQRMGLTIKLAAPTGRAAHRLSEICDSPASTIHRLLRFDPMSRAFVHDQSEPLPADVVIVDESSMIDLPLATSLFRAIPLLSRVIVVGDADQLPSVGPGLFLSNLLSLDEVPRVRLTKLFRRAEESPITYIAHQVNKAILPDIPVPDGVTKGDAYFLPAPEPTKAAETIEKLVVDQIPKKFGVPSNQIMVLTPMNQGELGTIGLNRRLQERMVPLSSGFPRVMMPHIQFRLGDRVCQRVNNYSLDAQGVFNGDQGTVVAVDSERKALVVRLWDGREIEYQEDVLGQLDLAYAITIHRSQGSESPAVVLALHEQHGLLLDRQLLYTAITRAKKLLVIVGSKRAMLRATQRNRSRARYTYLSERVRMRVEHQRTTCNI